MSITRLFVFNTVHEAISTRPAGDRKLYVEAVKIVLFQEKLAHFQAEGKVLSPDFKTNPMVEKVAKAYHSDVKKIWLACHENVDLVRQKSWFAKFVDLSKVDFASMLSDPNEPIQAQVDVQNEPIEAQVDVQEEPIEAQVDMDIQDEPMEEVILDQYIPVVPVAQLTPLAPVTPVASTSVTSSPPKLSKAFNDYSPRQQFNLAKNIKDYFGPEAIQRAIKQHFRASGNKSAEFILDEISSDPDLANDVKEYIQSKKGGGAKQPKSVVDPLEPLDCLSMMFKEDMSTNNWTVRILFLGEQSKI